jgi:acyl-coenzyme A thioesterase PaaI-like protein
MEMKDAIKQHLSRWEASSRDPLTGAQAEKRRLAAAMRLVIERLVRSDAPEDELARAADALERYAVQLDDQPLSNKYEGWAETGPSGDVAAFFDQSPVIGLANPLSPPVTLEADAEGKQVRGRAIFGSAYEGAPGCVHGGYVAAAFDELLGYANSLSGNPGMTGTLTIRYRKTTPLHTELRFEAHLDRVSGRKIFTVGRVYAGELLTAEAEGLFISVDRERMRQLFEQRQRRQAGG